VDAALERLRELAQRQEQEAERMRRQSGGPPNMGGGGGGSQRQLAEQTEELARRLERLAREKSNPRCRRRAAAAGRGQRHAPLEHGRPGHGRGGRQGRASIA
jgi:hypothetical protein